MGDIDTEEEFGESGQEEGGEVVEGGYVVVVWIAEGVPRLRVARLGKE